MNTESTTLRVRIAEAQGWKLGRFTCLGMDYCVLMNPAGKQVGFVYDNESDILGMWAYHTPNWPEDLNACAQFEAGLTKGQCFYYRDELQKLVLKTTARCSEDFVFGATARHRCLAYLATINPEEGK